MIRKCVREDLQAMYAVINDAASAYKGVIPGDRWHEPYMPREEIEREIADGVEFYVYEVDGELIGVMGIQPISDVTLIRHAYVETARRNEGIGGKLLQFLLAQTSRPVLVGTWKAATWAISFYKKHGFSLVSEEEKDRLLRKYWKIPERQIETSVVLGDRKWFSQRT